MPEALTESFCERCGTRYEFAAPTKLNTARKTRGLISGLKNYIMSQDALGDAVGDALRSEEEMLAAQQLDAFHKSFNFCIDCRQYACTNCWNESAGRCRTCVPIAGTDDLIERFEATFHAQHPELAAEAHMAEVELNRRLGIETWPTEDLSHAATNGHLDAEWPAAELGAGAEAPQPELAPEPMAPEPPEPVEEPALVPAIFPAVAGQPALHLVTWEEDTAFELEPEPMVAEAEPEIELEPEPMVAEAETEVEPEVASEPMLAQAEPEVAPEAAPEPQPEPQPAAPPPPQPIRPISETLLRIPRPAASPEPALPERVAAQADDASVAARRAQLELLGLGDPGEGPVAPQRTAMPYRSSGAAVGPVELAAHRSAQAAQGAAAQGSFWEASAKEVAGAITQVGVQACGECGLSLSASARFCRRCGTRQARSA